MIAGQAAGVVAALASRGSGDARRVDVGELQRKLEGAILRVGGR